MKDKKFKSKFSPTKIIALGYLCIIAIGTLLLTMPFSSRSGEFTPFIDSLFTATSATCVTGLVVYDTYTHWSIFGQLVILTMIQLGGIGFMTLSVLALSVTKRKIGLRQRSIMQESVSANQVGGIVRMTRFIFVTTVIFEIFGAILLSTQFCKEFGIIKGLYFSVFHSVSAFCNAGFDLMGGYSGEFSSLTGFADNYVVSYSICFLIIVGGLGFFVMADLYKHKFKIRRYALTTKIVLTSTAFLLILGTVVIAAAEADNKNFENLPLMQRITAAFFQSTTTRTAGFNTVDLNLLADASILIMIPLMLIGGSPGSTAGGLKTTTITLMLSSIISTLKRKKAVECYKRRISNDLLLHLTALVALFTVLLISSSILISIVDDTPIKSVLFETASALGTVGLSLGITPSLSSFSHIILAILMYLGRVGCFTVLFAIKDNVKGYVSKYPVENVTIG